VQVISGVIGAETMEHETFADAAALIDQIETRLNGDSFPNL